MMACVSVFFFQAEDGIRDVAVTGVQTCALPISALPAIRGKLELESEGERQGPESIAKDLIRRAAGKTFESRVGGANVDDIVHWFDEGGALKISMDERSETCLKGFSVVPGLLDLVDQ